MQVVFLIGLCAFACTATASSASSPLETIIEEWKTWKSEYRKEYSVHAGEELKRMEIWMENKAQIERHNRGYIEGKHSYTLRMNNFGDLSPEEFLASSTGGIPLKESELASMKTFKRPKHLGDLEDYFDWRDSGIVTPVKSQGYCGACWAFAAIGALESDATYFRGSEVLLSEQNLLDCTSSYGNNGCGGGNPSNSFRYVEDNAGVDTQDSYPYEGDMEDCTFSSSDVGENLSNFGRVTPGDEEAMRAAIRQYGPVTAGVYAGGDPCGSDDLCNMWSQFYDGGVFESDVCGEHGLNHFVLITGWGTDEDSGLDYWIIKNSWGTNWGDEGYIKFRRNAGGMGMCAIASQVDYVDNL